MRVGILGGGKWGQALARLVMAAGHDPMIAWRDERPPHVLPSSNRPPEVADQSELLIVATSATRVREAIQLAQPGPQHRIVVAGRGLDPSTGAWLTDVVLQECDALRVGALSGPAPVSEILNGGLCAGVVASRYDEVREMTATALHSPRFRVYQSKDLTGVQVAGAMMPVLATLLGIAMSLGGAGVGIKAMVISRGMVEAVRLGKALGAKTDTFLGMAGLGDLAAVQTWDESEHYRAGKDMVNAQDGNHNVDRARAILKLARLLKVEMPLTETLVRIADGSDPIDEVSRLMRRNSSIEI